MKKKETTFYIKPSLFGIVRVDSNTQKEVQGIMFERKNDEIGLVFASAEKIFFIHGSQYLSYRSIIDSLRRYKDWLGENFTLHLICHPLQKNETHLMHNSDSIEFFIAAIAMYVQKENFTLKEFKYHVEASPNIIINRNGKISKGETIKNFQTDSHSLIRHAINNLNYFTSTKKKEETINNPLDMIALLSHTPAYTINHPHMELDLQYDITKWCSPPLLDKNSAMATRYYKFFRHNHNPVAFFNALREKMPDEIEMRIFQEMQIKALRREIFNLGELFKYFQTASAYYDGLLKKATGELTKQTVQAYKANDYAKSESLAREALNIITVSGSSEAVAVAHYNLGSSLVQQKKYDEGVESLKFAKNLYENLDKPDKSLLCSKKIESCELDIKVNLFDRYHRMHPVHDAVRRNQLEIVQSLFLTNPTVLLEKDEYGWTALTYAIFFRVSMELIHFITDNAPDTATQTYYGEFSEPDRWELDWDIDDCDTRYSLLRFALSLPKHFQPLIGEWSLETQLAIVARLLKDVPRIKYSNDQAITDLDYAFLRKVPLKIIQRILQEAPELINGTETLTTAILSNAPSQLVKNLVDINLAIVDRTSNEYGISPIFAAIHANASMETIGLLLKFSPISALQLSGSRFLSEWSRGEDSDDDVEYISIPDTSLLFFALNKKKFAEANFLLGKLPAIAFLKNSHDISSLDCINSMLTKEGLTANEKAQLIKLQKKIIFLNFLQYLLPEDIYRIIHLQAVIRGVLSRKTNSIAQLKARYWPEVKQKAHELIERLVSSERYFEISQLTHLLHKNSLTGTLNYMRQLKWFDELPDGILFKIMTCLNGVEVIRLSQVSKRYARLATNQSIWKQKILAELTLSPRSFFVSGSADVMINNYSAHYRKMLLRGYTNTYYSDGRERLLSSSYYTFLNTPGKKWTQKQLVHFMNSALILGAEKWVTTLLQCGVIPTLSLFQYALIENAPHCAKLLVQGGLDINTQSLEQSSDKKSLFDIGLLNIRLDVLHFLFTQPNITLLPELHQAAALGERERLQALLINGHNINQRDIHHYTAIFWAVVMGHTSIVQELMRQGATLHGEENLLVQMVSVHGPIIIDKQHSLLILAVLFKQWEIARLLLPHFPFLASIADARLRVQEGPSISLLQVLAARGDIEGMMFLLSFQPSSKPCQHNPLVFAAKNGHTASVEYLIQQKFPVNECIEFRYYDGDGCLVRSSDTPLGVAAESGHLQCMQLLLQAGADPNQSYVQYFYQKPNQSPCISFSGLPLHKLAQYLARASILLENELNFTTFNIASSTSIAKVIEILRLLLKATKSVDAVDEYNQHTALVCLVSPPIRAHFSDGIQKKNYEQLIIYCVQLCLEAGATIHHQYGYSKETVLHAAAREGRAALLVFLLEHGADPALKNTKGYTPRMLVKEERCCQILDEWALKADVKQSNRIEPPASKLKGNKFG